LLFSQITGVFVLLQPLLPTSGFILLKYLNGRAVPKISTRSLS
jgi:hypothetical protein